jgi:hypothetical protein
LKRQQFLTPLPSGRAVWNSKRRVDREFLSTECSSFQPHADYGLVPEEVLDKFCCERGGTFLSAMKLLQRFGTVSLEEEAEATVRRLGLFQISCGAGGRSESQQR